jgi:thiol-disulfide isomerase/thioredoxin
MKKLILFLTLMTLFIMPGCSKEKEKGSGKGAPAQTAKAVEGAAAPDFTVKDLEGKDVALSSLKGTVVMVNFWATWCPPCKEEIPSLIKLNKAMTGKSFRMLAIAVDEGGKDPVQKFFKGNKDLPAYLDPDGKVSQLYGTTGVPETFIVDKQGIIQKKIVGGMDWSSQEVISYMDDLLKK